MEAATSTPDQAGEPQGRRLPRWVLGVAPLVIIALSIGLFVALGAPGLGERTGPPIEEIAFERTVLHPGTIELTLRNDGPDPVTIGQVSVNDAFVPYTLSGSLELGRLDTRTLTVPFPWIEGEAYEISILTSTGATILHEIPAAAETPEADSSFFGLMALLGIYVGVIPVALGMLWLPFVRRIDASWIRFLMAFTIGLLAFLGIDAALEGLAIAGTAPGSLGGSALVIAGALVAYIALAGVDGWLATRKHAAKEAAASGARLALLVAIGIGLHNLGEGLAIGSAYATGALALGAFLVVGFALHNTTEGLAIVAPLAGETVRLRVLILLGLAAGAPAILGAWIGASAFNPSLAAAMFGLGVGAIARVIQQLVPSIRDSSGQALNPLAAGGLLCGIGIMYLTSLLVGA